jgi:uncharacterized membrane protein
MRRWLSIFLLVLLAANFTGGYFYFVVRSLQIKHEMRALLKTLPEDKLIRISLTKREFERVRVEEHEIKINGKMYDIARVKLEGEIFHVYCVHDEAEDNLLSFLNNVLIRLQNDSTQLPVSVSAFAMLLFIATEFTFEFQNIELERLMPTPYRQNHFFVSLTIGVPPPRV